MSVLINMEMPTSCYMCWALDDYGDYPRCRITEEQRGYKFPIRQKRMDNCPLVPVPEHGDLIERDALKPYMLNEHYKYRLVYDAVEVANAPTIIPASGGKEDE